MCLLVAAQAQALRCGSRVVTTGDRTFEVRERCGEPEQVERWTVKLPFRYGDGALDGDYRRWPYPGVRTVLMERWLYNFGSHRLMRLLHFEDGVLKKIETLGHGHGYRH